MASSSEAESDEEIVDQPEYPNGHGSNRKRKPTEVGTQHCNKATKLTDICYPSQENTADSDDEQMAGLGQDSVGSTSEIRSDDFEAQRLRNKVAELEKKLLVEQKLVKQLQSSNLMLQKGLPDLLKRMWKETLHSFIAKNGKSTLFCSTENNENFKEDIEPMNCDVHSYKRNTVGATADFDKKECTPNGKPIRDQEACLVANSAINLSNVRLRSLSMARNSGGTIDESASMSNEETDNGAITSSYGSPPFSLLLDDLPGYSTPGLLSTTSDISQDTFSPGENPRVNIVKQEPCTSASEATEGDSSCGRLIPLSVFFDSTQISRILRAETDRKMAAVMLGFLFDKDHLGASSVTGKSREGRPALDPDKVELIISHVSNRFPLTTRAKIKVALAQKCKDCRKRRARIVKTR